MEKRIELEKRRRSSAQVYELNLDNCRSTSIEGLTDEFVNLRNLSLISVGLTSLKGFPKLSKLRKLELSDNRISGGFHVLKDCINLTVLNLSNNKIKDTETLEPLKELKKLKNLDLYRNEVTSTEGYREKIFEMLPNLVYLEGVDRSGKEAEESEDEDIEEKVNGKDEDDEDGDEVDDEEIDDENIPEIDEESEDGEGEAEDEEEEEVQVSGSKVALEGGEDGGVEDVEEEEEEEEEDDEDESAVGLKDIYGDTLEDRDSDEDYEAIDRTDDPDEHELDSDDEFDEEEVQLKPRAAAAPKKGAEDAEDGEERRGKKRPHEEEDGN